MARYVLRAGRTNKNMVPPPTPPPPRKQRIKSGSEIFLKAFPQYSEQEGAMLCVGTCSSCFEMFVHFLVIIILLEEWNFQF